MTSLRPEKKKVIIDALAPRGIDRAHDDAMTLRKGVGSSWGRTIAGFGIGTMIFAGIIFFIGNTWLVRAHIEVEPVLYTGVLDTSLQAHSQGLDATDLTFRTMTLEHTDSVLLPATGTEQVAAYAEGTIVIYNETNKPQKFREETRFQSTDGHIFKLPQGDGVTVPAGTPERPGAVEARVIAEKPGPAYNIEHADFTIPGWKEIDDPRFDTQYARSQSPMTGGASGMRPIVDDAMRRDAIAKLTASNRKVLEGMVLLEKPDDVLVFPSGMYYAEGEPRTTVSDKGEARIELTSSVMAIVFPTDVFANVLARTLIGDQAPRSEGTTTAPLFSLQNPEQLTLTFGADTATLLASFARDTLTPSTLSLRVQGEPLFTRVFDRQAFVQSLVGISAKDVPSVLVSFPGIQSMTVHVKPVWKSRLPQSVDDMKVEITYPKHKSQATD